MSRFRQMANLQRFASTYASIFNHFNHYRSLNSRSSFKQQRTAALAEWRHLLAA